MTPDPLDVATAELREARENLRAARASEFHLRDRLNLAERETGKAQERHEAARSALAREAARL